MTQRTDDYNLLKLDVGDSLFAENAEFVQLNIDKLARLARLGAETHKHNGAVSAAGGVEVGARDLDLTLLTDAGGIPAGVRVYYKFTLVDTEGFESEPSDAVFVDTAQPVLSPGAPTLTTATTGGVLLPGNYYYVLTAYVGSNTLETKGISPKYISVPAGTSTNTITVDLPALPTGADGFNIYRKKPGGVRYDYLTSIDMTVATPPTEFEDDGSIEEDCDRTIPTQNFTNMQNHVEVELTGDPLDPGVTWKLYRTYVLDDYSNSLIAHVTSGVTFDDIGLAPNGGIPLVGLEVSSPTKIDLTDGEEVQGRLPQGMVSAFPYVVTLFFPGILTDGPGDSVWSCPFDNAIVMQATAALGRDSVAAADDVITDIVIGRGATPVFGSVYLAEADMPTILVGTNKTETAAVATETTGNRQLVAGDVISADLIQVGGGATPTDEDLTVSILIYVESGDPAVSVVWP